MRFRHIVITGGAGFVGANLTIRLLCNFDDIPIDIQIPVHDNMKRTGSDLHLPRQQARQVEFVHGDVRCEEDLQALPASSRQFFRSTFSVLSAGFSAR